MYICIYDMYIYYTHTYMYMSFPAESMSATMRFLRKLWSWYQIVDLCPRHKIQMVCTKSKLCAHIISLREPVVVSCNVSRAQRVQPVHMSILCASQCSCRADCREHKKCSLFCNSFCSVDVSVSAALRALPCLFCLDRWFPGGVYMGREYHATRQSWWRDRGVKPRNCCEHLPHKLSHPV